MRTRTGSRWLLSASCVACICGLALAADLDTSGQAGQYETTRAATRVKGSTGEFPNTRIWVPFILLNVQPPAGQPALVNPRQALFDAAGVEEVNGNPVGVVTTFATGPTNPNPDRVLAVLGTTDMAGGGFSNNVMIKEDAAKSDAIGSILPDGTIVYLEGFSSTAGAQQNGLGLITGVTGILPQTAPEPVQQGQIFSTGAALIDNAAETTFNATGTIGNPAGTVAGSVFVGTPSAVRDPNAVNRGADDDLLTGQTHFNGLPVTPIMALPATVNGVMVYRGTGNFPHAADLGCFTTGDGGTPGPDHIAAWMQVDDLCNPAPFPLNTAGEDIANIRQTQPVLAVVNRPAGGQMVYVAHGVGFSGTSTIGGGSARPIYIAVDTITNPNGSPRLNYAGANATLANNTILIEADAMGGEGSVHGKPFYDNSDTTPPAAYADIATTNADKRFVDHQATGGGSTFSNSQFDMNSAGQVAALWEDRSVSPRRYEVRVYDPIWNGAGTRIEGYLLGKVVTFNGDVGLLRGGAPIVVDQLTTTTNNPATGAADFQITLDPISGVAISDDGRVAFVAATEKEETLGNWDNNASTAQTLLLRSTTNDLYVWEPSTDSIHSILRGGQNGDTLVDAFPGSGPVANETVDLGFFPLDVNSDSFNREAFSRSGEYLAVVFRNSSNVYIGGVNTEYGFLPDPDGTVGPATAPPDTYINRGGILYAAGQKGNNERSVRGVAIVSLGAFAAAPPCCPGNADKIMPGQVTFNDVLAVLANFLNPGANPDGSSVGDANCNGVIDFNDVLNVLANFLALCP